MLKLILKTASKSCNLNPIPTPLTKQYQDVLVPVITKIINTFLTTGIVPGCFMSAVVRPVHKKPGLDVNDFKNLRPVSSLPFLSKIHFKKLFWHNLDPTCLETTSVKFASQLAYIGTITILRHFCTARQGKADNRFVSLLTLLRSKCLFWHS